MDPARRLARRTQHVGEELELSPVAADVWLIRGREMREETIDLEVPQLADRREASGRIRYRRTQTRGSGVDLEVHTQRATRGRGALVVQASTVHVPYDQRAVGGDGRFSLGAIGRARENEHRCG